MKNINLIWVVALIFTLGSCESLDIEPGENDVIQPDLENIEDLNKSMIGVYEGLKEEGAYTGFLIAFFVFSPQIMSLVHKKMGTAPQGCLTLGGNIVHILM